jgi:hypothetical protein
MRASHRCHICFAEDLSSENSWFLTMEITVLWDLMPCSVVYHPENGGNGLLPKR